LLAGKDATEAFEDVGHSDEARDLLKDMLVGDFEGTTAVSPCTFIILLLSDCRI
jgi:cytochrome b involved in lipid metabolism